MSKIFMSTSYHVRGNKCHKSFVKIDEMKKIAERLKYARDLRGLTQAQLAAASGVSTGTIGNIESGLRQAKGSIPQIAEALRVNYKWLAEGEGEITPPASEVADKRFEALRRIYKAVHPDHRNGAVSAAMIAMSEFMPGNSVPIPEPVPHGVGETPSEALPSSQASSKTQ